MPTPLEERQQVIKEIEAKRGSRVITYVTGDRPGGGVSLELQLTMEPTIVPVFYEALRGIQKTENIDLFLYTRGGAVDVVWPLVSLIREFKTKKFTVLIPFRAHSAGTLMAMGADNILMCEAAELTSVDPTTGNPFNPVDELTQGKRKGISVEDVTAYFGFARDNEKVKLNSPEHVLEVFKQLTSQIHPLALGHVQRVHTQIRVVAEKLLRLHYSGKDKKRISTIISTLTEKLYSHTHAVNRRDAQKIFGDTVVFPNDEESELIWKLFERYSEALKLREPHNLLSELGSSQQLTNTYSRGFVETSNYSSVFQSDARITVGSAQIANSIYSQKAQEKLQGIEPTTPGFPTFVPGLPPQFCHEVLYEGWRLNQKGV